MPNKGETATLTSPTMANLQTQCLRFYFLRGGAGVSLRLYQSHVSSGRVDPTLWQLNETHLVNEWIRVQQNLLITGDPVTVNFEAKKADYSSSPILLDDISLTPFQCDPPITCR